MSSDKLKFQNIQITTDDNYVIESTSLYNIMYKISVEN